jgi:hypothetical protein
MSKILIETYRGFDIEFDTNFEKFQCVATDEKTKESVSFTAVKKFIDDHLKENQNFKSFCIESIPNFYGRDPLNVVGLRKDGRFVAENEKGEKVQIPEYNEKEYMLVVEENKHPLLLLKELKEKLEKQRIESDLKRKEIVSMMKIITLKEYKEKLNL